ncbi:hypothetical protein EDB86DRAFT_2188840 [Lactarius hatsudake]|nr:hypothetical protein EDB86DRAFT_2188840 [Lactarius hatsudake]
MITVTRFDIVSIISIPLVGQFLSDNPLRPPPSHSRANTSLSTTTIAGEPHFCSTWFTSLGHGNRSVGMSSSARDRRLGAVHVDFLNILAALGAVQSRRAHERVRTSTTLLGRVAIHVLVGGESLRARRQAGRSGRGRGEVVESREATEASHVGAGGQAPSGSEVAGSRHRMHRRSAYDRVSQRLGQLGWWGAQQRANWQELPTQYRDKLEEVHKWNMDAGCGRGENVDVPTSDDGHTGYRLLLTRYKLYVKPCSTVE